MTEENVNENVSKESTQNLIERLQKASNEIDTIHGSFMRGMEDLSKIQSILKLDGVNDISKIMQSFENRLSDAEKQKEEAVEGAKKFSEELEREKERLVKLWDAYKNQEEELATQERKAQELEEKLKGLEQSKIQLEQDTTARINTLTQKLEEKNQEVGQIEEFKQKEQDFDNIKNQLEETVHDLRSEINAKDSTITELNSKIEELSKFENSEEWKNKFEEVSVEFEKEKERLTKLFRLYEETEAENKKLKEDINKWQNWFDTNQAKFSNIFDSADHLRKTTSPETNTKSDIEIEPMTPKDQPKNPEEKKPKKRFRLRK